MSINYCRRKVTKDGKEDYCCKPIKTRAGNALQWCDECRARLPFWPADDAPAAPTMPQNASPGGLPEQGVSPAIEEPAPPVAPEKSPSDGDGWAQVQP